MSRAADRVRALWTRYRGFAARRGGQFRFSIALGIVAVSILSATMAWRASIWSEVSSNTDELTRQDVIEQQQILGEQAERVTQDLRVFARFEEHSLLAEELERDARSAGGDVARELRVRAQGEQREADSLRAFFVASQPVAREDSELFANYPLVFYDPADTRRSLAAGSSDLETLRPDELRAQARAAHVTAVRLTGLAALFVAALFFLTLAEVTRQGISRWFAGVGVALAFISAGLFFLV